MEKYVGMKTKQNKISPKLLLEILFYLMTFAAIMTFALIQPFGDPPDEINRFKIVYYVFNHATIPHGANPEVLIDGYGASYAFQPILTYMLEGYLMRVVGLFTRDSYVLLLTARMVNVVFGVCFAYFVRAISKKLWKSESLQWLFTLMVVFLPENLFIHSYVNTDSMAMLAVAIIVYSMLYASEVGFTFKSMLLMAIGVVLCAMSYYNAYGIILCAVIFVVAYYIRRKSGAQDAYETSFEVSDNYYLDIRPMVKTALIITGMVLVGAGWWFLHNAIIYHGDFLGMSARQQCAIETAMEEFNPLTRFTYKGAGYTMSQMLSETGYFKILRDSFIAMFGPMAIPTHGLIYIFYQWIYIAGFACLLIPIGTLITKKAVPGRPEWEDFRRRNRYPVYFYGLMIFHVAITIWLSVYYSFFWEYQPQGRYVLPMLIPMMVLVVVGYTKLAELIRLYLPEKLGVWVVRVAVWLAIAFVVLALAYSIFNRFIPYYQVSDSLESLKGVNIADILEAVKENGQ